MHGFTGRTYFALVARDEPPIRQSSRWCEPEFDRFSTSTVKGKQKNSKIDWAISLGNNGGMPVAETPAKYSFDISLAPDCTKDFVVYVIAATPGAGQANIVAFNNLYNGTGTGQQTCGGTDPNTMWSYRVGNGPNFLSPVLSLDGKKVAFISSSTPNATFNVLTWVAGQGSSPTSPVLPGTVAPRSSVSTTQTQRPQGARQTQLQIAIPRLSSTTRTTLPTWAPTMANCIASRMCSPGRRR